MADELQSRMKNIETEVKKLQTDFRRVETKLDKLILSLTGDDISEGALKSLSKRISEQEKDLVKKLSEQEKDINNLSKSLVKLTQSSLTTDEHKAIRDLLSVFKGWKLIIALGLWLLPLVTFIIERIFK